MQSKYGRSVDLDTGYTITGQTTGAGAFGGKPILAVWHSVDSQTTRGEAVLKRRIRCRASSWFAAALLVSILQAEAQEKDQVGHDRVPRNVMDCLKTRFPKAQIDKWTKETEGGTVVFDIEFRQDGRKFEADIKEDGTIQNWEEAISPEDLPSAVAEAVAKKYPKASMKEIMAITRVTTAKETLEGYEIVLRTADTKDVELTVSPDGRILEDTGNKK